MDRNRQVRPRRQASPSKRTEQHGPARLVVPAALALCFLLVLVTFATAGKPGGDEQAGTKAAAQKTSKRPSSQKSGAKQTSDERSNGTQGTRPALYKVKRGDSFGAISEKTGVDARDLAELNPDVDPRALQPGQQLKLR